MSIIMVVLGVLLLFWSPAFASRIALELVALQGLQGQEILVNPNAVSSVREPQEVGKRYLAPGTKCVLLMSDGTPIHLSETCGSVRDKLGKSK